MPSAPGAQAEVVDPRSLEWLAQLARPLVFTNGVFDILHRGHVTYLAQARAMGASLLVALNGDASAARLGKGAGRPLNPLADRLAVVAALAAVSAVTWFEEDTPEALIVVCGYSAQRRSKTGVSASSTAFPGPGGAQPQPSRMTSVTGWRRSGTGP